MPPEVRAQYVAIIDSILTDADLTTISVKQVRNGIQEKVQYDITPHKSAINDLVRDRFDVVEAKRHGAEEPVPSVEAADEDSASVTAPHTNGVHKSKSSDPSAATPSTASTSPKREASSEPLSDVDDSAPPKKKRKANAVDDAALAAKLQAEERMKARPTRGGGTRKAAPVKKKTTPKKKTQARVTGSDDSDVAESPRVVNRNTGFHVGRLLSRLIPSHAL